MRFGNLILKNLTRRPARTLLTLLALATAITAVVALFGVANGFSRSFAEIYAAHGVDIVVSRQGSADRLSSSVDQQYIARLAQLAGVLRTAGVMLETLSLEAEGIYGLPTMGVEPGSWLLGNYQFVRRQSAGLVDPGQSTGKFSPSSDGREVMLGIHLADRLNKGVGDMVELFDEPYRIAGVFQSTSTWENGSMILPLDQLQRLTDRPGQVTYINVVLDRNDAQWNAESVVAAIHGLDKRLLALTTSEYVETDTRMQIAQAMAWMTSLIALIVGAIGTLNTMLTSVLERTREIGILRAIGWSRRRVVAMILGESCGLAAVASLLGVLFALLLTWALSRAPAARGLISPAIDLPVVVQGFALAMFIGLLGALLPAWRAARLAPTEAFREY